MPGYGKKYKSKRKYSKKGYKRKRFNITQQPRNRTSHLRTIKWSNRDSTFLCHNTNQGSDTVTEAVGAATFQLSDLTNYTELTSVFDQYRLVKVLYRWVITKNTDWVTTAANRGFPVRILWAHDFNDSTPPTTTDMMQRAGMREIYMHGDEKPASRWYTLNPAMLVVGYESSTNSSYTPKWRQWIDISSYSTPHYGLKWYAANLYAGLSLRLEAKCVYEFKGVQ